MPPMCACSWGRAYIPQVSIHSRWDTDDMTSCYHDNGCLVKALWHEPTCWLIMKLPLLLSPLPLSLEWKKDRLPVVVCCSVLHALPFVFGFHGPLLIWGSADSGQVSGYRQSISNQFTWCNCSSADCFFSKLPHLRCSYWPAIRLFWGQGSVHCCIHSVQYRHM